jgi:hypothetical protein
MKRLDPLRPGSGSGSAAEPTAPKGHSVRRVIWGVTPAHMNPSDGGRLLWAMRPKFSAHTIPFWSMMRKHVPISSPTGR